MIRDTHSPLRLFPAVSLCRECRFTLIELVVVLAIIGAATSLVMSSFRGESDSVRKERIAAEWEAWLMKIRYRAMEEGRDFIIRWDEEKKRMTAQGEYSETETMQREENNQLPPAPLFWKLPEGSTLSLKEETITVYAPEEEYGREVIRFYSDGGAIASSELLLRCGKEACRFDFSPLTGELIRRDGDGENETEAEFPTGFRTIEQITGTAEEEIR